MKTLYNILLTLVIIGALNWGILGLFKVDLIGSIFGGMTSMPVSYTHLTLPTILRV